MEDPIIIVEELRLFYEKVIVMKTPEELFGKIDGKTKQEKLSDIKNIYKKLALKYNADKYDIYNSGIINYYSKEIMTKVGELNTEAQKRIDAGIYGTKKRYINDSDVAVINVGNKKYYVFEKTQIGDMANMFIGGIGDDINTSEPVHIKIARDRDDNGQILSEDDIEFNNRCLVNEINVLKRFDAIQDADFQKVRSKHYPYLIDNFRFNDGASNPDGVQASVLKINKLDEMIDLESFRKKWPSGVPLHHVCWIAERLFSAVAHMNKNKILLAGGHPAGILVRELNHNIVIGDFKFSIIDYASDKAKYTGWIDNFTAPEVLRKAKPHPRTDIYSVAKILCYLLGGDVQSGRLPKNFEMIPGQQADMNGVEELRGLIAKCMDPEPGRRIDDAGLAYWRLKEYRKMAFGNPKFIPIGL